MSTYEKNELDSKYLDEFNKGKALYEKELNIVIESDPESMDFFLSKEHQKAYDFGYSDTFKKAFPNFFKYIKKNT